MDTKTFEALSQIESVKIVNKRQNIDATLTVVPRAQHGDVVVQVAGRFNGASVNDAFAVHADNFAAVGNAIVSNIDSQPTVGIRVNSQNLSTRIIKVTGNELAQSAVFETGDGSLVTVAAKKKKKKKKGGGTGGGGGGGGGGGLLSIFGDFLSSIISAAGTLVTSLAQWFFGKLAGVYGSGGPIVITVTVGGSGGTGGGVTTGGGCTKPPDPAF